MARTSIGPDVRIFRFSDMGIHWSPSTEKWTVNVRIIYKKIKIP
jgi:hypothetical protein